MRTALLIAAKDLRQRVRDRSVILFAIVAPLGLAFIFSLLLRGATEFHADYVVADLDGGSLAVAFGDEVLGGLEQANVATIATRPTEAEARAAVETATPEGWKADAAFIIPVGFSEAILAGQPTSIEVLGARDAGLQTEVARSVAARFADSVASAQLAVHTVAELRGAQPTAAEMAGIIAAARDPAIVLGQRRLAPPAVVVHLLLVGDGDPVPVLRGAVGDAQPVRGATAGHARPDARRADPPGVRARRQGRRQLLTGSSRHRADRGDDLMLGADWGRRWASPWSRCRPSSAQSGSRPSSRRS
jgi:hypothetical protein